MTRTTLSRRALLAAPAIIPVTALAAPAPRRADGLDWYDVRDWGVEGRAWNDTARYFDRFPARAEKSLRPALWNLSRHSAGMAVRFRTNSRAIHVRYSLLSANLAMPHMPATGVSGLDLYAEDERGRLGWVAVVMANAQTMNLRLGGDLDPLPGGAARGFTIYLPLYNGVEQLEIGVLPESRFEGLAPRAGGSLVFYGTSIMHGACASRPGIAMTAIIGRRLNRPTVNLGFSGNGQMEPAVTELLCELDPAAYAIDCLPNMTPQAVGERTAPLVRRLRAARPETPILLVEDRTFTNAGFYRATRTAHTERRAALRGAYETLRREGVRRLGYLRGADLLGDDGEGATDGSHPNDLGMLRNAKAYLRALRPLL